jgi:hypothetical protein
VVVARARAAALVPPAQAFTRSSFIGK